MGKVLIVLNIDLGGRNEELWVREGDEALEVAQGFVRKHGLGIDAEIPIYEFITRTVAKLVKVNSKALTPNGLKSTFSPNQNLSKSFVKSKSLKKPCKLHIENPGDRNYHQAILRDKLKDTKISKILAERKTPSKQLLTFRPYINLSRSQHPRTKKENDFQERQKTLIQRNKGQKPDDEQESKNQTTKPNPSKPVLQENKLSSTNRGIHLFYSSERQKNAINTKSPTSKIINSKFKLDLSPKLLDQITKSSQKPKSDTKLLNISGGYSARENYRPPTNFDKQYKKRQSEKSLKKSHENFHSGKNKKKLNTSLKLIKYEEVNKKFFNIINS